MQKFFLYMLTRSADPKYLRYLEKPVDEEALRAHREGARRLWSTPLLLHLAGIPCESYEFLPVSADCREDGHMTWSPAEKSLHHIFRIRDNDREREDSFDMTGSYRAEMIGKLREMLEKIG